MINNLMLNNIPVLSLTRQATYVFQRNVSQNNRFLSSESAAILVRSITLSHKLKMYKRSYTFLVYFSDRKVPYFDN